MNKVEVNALSMRSAFFIALLGIGVFSFLSFHTATLPEYGLIDPHIGVCEIEFERSGSIRMSHPAPKVRLYYTSDGNDPMHCGTLYNKPLEVNALLGNEEQAYIPTGIKWRRPIEVDQDLVVICSRALRNDGVWGPLSSATFPVGALATLDVVSIITAPSNLFDPDTGILCTGNAYLYNKAQQKRYAKNDAWWIYPGNYSERGKEWERSASFEFISKDGHRARSAIGLRVNGNYTRAFSDHSLRILFDEPMEFQFFPENEYVEYEALILRNSGNDHHKSRMRDAVVATIAHNMDLETQAYRPVSLYINGVYWGQYGLRERLDDEYIAIRTGVKKQDVAILEDGGAIYRGSAMDSIDFFRSLGSVERADLNDPERYKEALQHFDINNFMDHMACELFFANKDWPLQNVKFWRHTSGNAKGTPWRWMLNDMDLSFGYLGDQQSGMDTFEHVADKSGPTARLFRALMGSATFRIAFRERFNDLLKNEFSTAMLLDRIKEIEQRLALEMPLQINRWRLPSGMRKWKTEVDVLRDFAKNRPDVMKDLISKYLRERDA